MNYSHIEVIPLYSNVASEIGYHIAQNSNGLKRGERSSTNKRNMNNVSALHIRSCERESTVHVVLFDFGGLENECKNFHKCVS